MALSVADIKAAYPLPTYNYKVTVMDSTTPVQIGCSEVSGLTVEYTPVTYRHGMSFLLGTNIIPGIREPLRVTLKKGLTARGDFLQKWLDLTYRDPLGHDTKKDVSVDLCNESGQPLIRWTLNRALPVKLEVSSFAATGNEVAIGTMELVAHDIKVDYLTV
jgi:phage tail-like protein